MAGENSFSSLEIVSWSVIQGYKLQKFIVENEDQPESFLWLEIMFKERSIQSILTENNKINCSFHG